MKKTFRIRDSEVTLIELENYRAWRVEENLALDRGAVPGTLLATSVDRFSEAGWILSSVRGLGVNEKPPTRAYIDSEGSLALGPPTLVVQLDCLEVEDPEQASRLFEEMGLRIVEQLHFADWLFVVTLIDVVVSPIDKSNTLRDAKPVLSIEPEILYSYDERRLHPGQWHLQNSTAQTLCISGPSGTFKRVCEPGADLNVVGAWEQGFEGQGKQVAVLDFAFEAEHQNLRPAFRWGGNYQFHGLSWKFFPVSKSEKFPTFDHRHGTRCSGMAIAQPTPEQPLRGVAPKAGWIPIGVSNVTSQIPLAKALAVAADPKCEEQSFIDEGQPLPRGADSLSVSLGPQVGRWVLETVLELALQFVTNLEEKKGRPIFWAVPNARISSGDQVCQDPRVIGIGSSSCDDDSVPNCAEGRMLDMLAPGEHVLTTDVNNGMTIEYGTSFAAPSAAAAAAILLQAKPEATWQEVRSYLRRACKKIGRNYIVPEPDGSRSSEFGFGRIDVSAAVDLALSPVSGAALEMQTSEVDPVPPTTWIATPRAGEAGRFGRWFPHLPAWVPAGASETDQLDSLRQLAEWMHGQPMSEEDSDNDNPSIPAGYTYLGQFVDHDLTFDATALPRHAVDAEGRSSARTPRFELDSVYAGGPRQRPELYSPLAASRGEMLLGSARALPGILPPIPPFSPYGFPAVAAPDLPRNELGIALAGDPRNDENVLVSQIHLAFLRFHNAVLGKVGDFERARQLVRWHYQWLVVFDLLPKLVGRPLVDEILGIQGNERVFHPGNERFSVFARSRKPLMPIEFSAAAFRLGHSMVRDRYHLSDSLTTLRNGEPVPTLVGDPGAHALADLRGSKPLPQFWNLQWNLFVDFGDGKTQSSRRIDPRISPTLAQLPQGPLALSNLIRGWRLGLPSGQAVARALGARKVYSNEELDLDDLDPPFVEAPLWFYVLKEADLEHGGSQMGPVGGRLVAETFLGLLLVDPTSFFRVDPRWSPTFGELPGTFDLKDLVTAGDLL